MTFSFSAPRFTEADEIYEREHLTEEEKVDAWKDVYGKNEPIPETPDMLKMADSQMTQELRNIPDKIAYMEALEACPEVVQLETPNLRFLRCEKFDAQLAARRLVKYWEMRKALFGERAFYKSMSLENGCLFKTDVDSLRLGHLFILPADNHGRTVLYEARGHLNADSIDHSSLLRAQWYMFHVALEQETSQTKGIVLITNNRCILPNHFSRRHEKLLWTAVSECLPLQIRAVHCCHLKSVMAMLLPIRKKVLGRRMRLRHIVHDDPSDIEALHALEQYGLCKEGLPSAFLGSFQLDAAKWIKDRIDVEEARSIIFHQKSSLVESTQACMKEEEQDLRRFGSEILNH